MISSTLVYRRMAFNVVLFLSLLTLHNICAKDFTEPKDESILEIIKHADGEEGIHPRRNSDPFDVKCSPVIPIENGHTVGHVSLEMGSIVQIRCNPGYHLLGEEQIQCQAVPSPFEHKAYWFHRVGDMYTMAQPQCMRQVTLKPTTISESIKDVRKNAKPEVLQKSFQINNLEDDDNGHVIPPRPLNFQGRAKILRDDHAHIPSEEEYEQIHVEVELTEDIKEVAEDTEEDELTEDIKEAAEDTEEDELTEDIKEAAEDTEEDELTEDIKEVAEDTEEVELTEDAKEVELAEDTKEVIHSDEEIEPIGEEMEPRQEEIELREDGDDEEIEPNCTLPYEVGKCRASKPRFYFNVKSGTCEQFIYGGCGGNGNNYMTKTDCEENCITSPDGASNST